MTSRDQLSVMEMAWLGLAGGLLSFSEGRSSVGPNTVARLCRDILFTVSFSATLWGIAGGKLLSRHLRDGGMEVGRDPGHPSQEGGRAPPQLTHPHRAAEGWRPTRGRRGGGGHPSLRLATAQGEAGDGGAGARRGTPRWVGALQREGPGRQGV